MGITTIAGPSLRMVFECEQPVNGSPIFTVQSVTSSDDGATWSDQRELVYAATGEGNNAGSPQIARVGGGRVAVVFMTDEDTSAHRWVGGSGVKMVVSADGGRTWGGKVEVGGVQSSWPGIVALGDGGGEGKGEALVLFDNGGSRVRKVTFG